MPATTPSTTPAVPEIRVSRTVTREPSAKSWAAGPIGAEPLLVQVGFTRFALRRSEAARIRLRNGAAA